MTHIHIGMPTRWRPAARGLAMSGLASFMESTVRCASSAGSTVAAAGGGSASYTIRTTLLPLALQGGQAGDAVQGLG
ncbi:hypothetical protein ACFZB2_39535 [Streptomyces bobili]|uniref:hypothetical protein n=1 Tax=Streptomyces bobili TaxID=67280 RepID=UPI0036EA91B3